MFAGGADAALHGRGMCDLLSRGDGLRPLALSTPAGSNGQGVAHRRNEQVIAHLLAGTIAVAALSRAA
ncbi:hypothetical protein FHR53_001867 [Xanthomonas arboricola]